MVSACLPVEVASAHSHLSDPQPVSMIGRIWQARRQAKEMHVTSELGSVLPQTLARSSTRAHYSIYLQERELWKGERAACALAERCHGDWACLRE